MLKFGNFAANASLGVPSVVFRRTTEQNVATDIAQKLPAATVNNRWRWLDMLKIKKEYESVNKTFRIPANLAEKLERLAGAYNTSVNKIVIQCLEYAIENLDTQEK